MIDKTTLHLLESLTSPKKEKGLLGLAEKNRVSFSYAQGLYPDVYKEGVKWQKKLTDTLKDIQMIVPAGAYCITRTYKYIPYVTFDVDLFSPKSEFSKIVVMFRDADWEVKSHDSSLGGRIPGAQVNIYKKDRLTIDFHQDFTWQKRRFLDPELLLKKNRKKIIAGCSVQVPSAEVEFLLCVADIAHERFNVTLLDVIWLKGLKKEIKDWNLIFNQVKRFKWLRTFHAISAILNAICFDLFNEDLITGVEKKLGNYSLPYFLPLNVCWQSYLENVKATKHFPLISFLYMHYTRIRYILTKGNKMPYYDSWFQ